MNKIRLVVNNEVQKKNKEKFFIKKELQSLQKEKEIRT